MHIPGEPNGTREMTPGRLFAAPVAAGLAAVFALSFAGSAQGNQCSGNPQDQLEAVWDDPARGDTVFIGSVVSVTDDNRYALFHVERVLRGTLGEHVTVENSAVTAARDEPPSHPMVHFIAGARYAVIGFLQRPGALLMELCTPSRQVSDDRAQALVQLADSAVVPSGSAVPILGLALLVMSFVTALLGPEPAPSLTGVSGRSTGVRNGGGR